MSPPCVPCGTHAGRSVQPCIRCGSALSHQHVQVVNRRGQTTADAPLCAPCMATLKVRSTPLTDALVAVEAGSL